jgi:hypothetical protein
MRQNHPRVKRFLTLFVAVPESFSCNWHAFAIWPPALLLEGAPQNDVGSSKQRRQKWLHFLCDTPNGQQPFADITAECSPDKKLTEA